MNRAARGAETERNGTKRRRILDAASRLFGGRDLACVRMEEVAAEAGVAKGTLYNYFASKEELYFSILRGRMEHLLKALAHACRSGSEVRIRLRKLTVHTLMFLLKYPDFFRMLRKQEAQPAVGSDDRIRSLRACLHDLVRTLIEEGVERGEIAGVDPARAADWILGAVEGAALGYLETSEKPARGSADLDRFFDFLWSGLSGRTRPLRGWTVLVTREEEPGEGLSGEIERRGGRPLLCPLVRTVPPTDPATLNAAARDADRYAWILFTSARAVEAFSAARGKRAAPLPAGTRIGGVGEATAAAARKRFGRVDLVASRASGEGLADALRRTEPLDRMRILLPRADRAGEALPEILRACGAEVDDVVAYRTIHAESVPGRVAGALARGEIDAVTFASGSAVEAFVACLGAPSLRSPGRTYAIISIGPSTTAVVTALGGTVDAEASRPSLEELADAVAVGRSRFAANRGSGGPAPPQREESLR
ncbi:MAG: TetR family transcriptional regulator [Candidatus Eisenbacteria bacterium]|nr:TetR family transcriptional regulator [Candidatus Latescibacterota bacterium]MBD3302910.1 TetR family transcriptional regulator [Candidatus Eisenbacteria bacterium]